MLKSFLIFLIIFFHVLYGKDEVKRDLGLGISFLSIPEYIGSSIQKQLVFPYPYIYYKSEKLTIKKNNLFNHIYKNKIFSIDLSFSGTIPVENEEDSLRYGMGKLDPTLEVGPKFIYRLISTIDSNKKSYLNLEIPIRTIWSVNLNDIKQIGYTVNPNLKLNYNLNKNEYFEITTGPTFSTKKYHNYFYQVTSKDVSDKREQYDSSSGYGNLL